MIETVDNTIEAEVSTAIVLWRPSVVIEGEVMPKEAVCDRTGHRWFWDMVIDPGSRRTVASYLGPFLVAEMLDQQRLKHKLPLSLPLNYAQAYPVHEGKFRTYVKFKYPEAHRINNESVVNGIKTGVGSLFKRETELLATAKGRLLQPFPLIVYPHEEENVVGFRLYQEYAVIGEMR